MTDPPTLRARFKGVVLCMPTMGEELAKVVGSSRGVFRPSSRRFFRGVFLVNILWYDVEKRKVMNFEALFCIGG